MNKTRMRTDLSITTPRFCLREYRENDRAAFISYQTDPEFTIYHRVDELGVEAASRVFSLFLAWQSQSPRLNFQLAVVPADDSGELIGSCGIRMEHCQPGEALLGLEFARPYWGKYRYAEEVAQAAIQWAFSNVSLTALVADTAPDNTRIARLAEAAGFVRTHRCDKQWWRLDRDTWRRREKQGPVRLRKAD